MPRVWHQPSLGRENIWMFHHLEHGECLGTISSCFLCYCGDTVLGVRSPTWLPCWSNMVWSPVACDTLLFFLFFYYSSDSSFFWRRSSHYWAGHPTVRGPTVRQLAHSVFLMDTRIFLGTFFVFCFCLVGIYIKTYFVLRYARYAIKSDYSNQIFKLCLRFLSWQYFWNGIH